MINYTLKETNSFEGSYLGYRISLKLTTQEKLEIRMKNQYKFCQYYLFVDCDYIKKEKNFTNIVQMPIDIFGLLIHHFQNVTVYGDTINLRYEVGTIRKITKNFSFKTVKQESVQYVAVKDIGRMKEDIWIVLSQKTNIISQLQQKIKAQQKRFNDVLQKTKVDFQQKLALEEAQCLQLQKNFKESQKTSDKQLQRAKSWYKSDLTAKDATISQLLSMLYEYVSLRINSTNKIKQNKELYQQNQKRKEEVQQYKKYYEQTLKEIGQRSAIQFLENSSGTNRWRKIASTSKCWPKQHKLFRKNSFYQKRWQQMDCADWR